MFIILVSIFGKNRNWFFSRDGRGETKQTETVSVKGVSKDTSEYIMDIKKRSYFKQPKDRMFNLYFFKRHPAVLSSYSSMTDSVRILPLLVCRLMYLLWSSYPNDKYAYLAVTYSVRLRTSIKKLKPEARGATSKRPEDGKHVA